jgi:type IV pilus assembly protein PilM
MARVLPTGGDVMTEALMASLSVPQADAERLKIALGLRSPESLGDDLEQASRVVVQRCQTLIESINANFAYYAQSGGRAVDHVVLTGGAAALIGFDQYVAAVLQIQVTLARELVADVLGAHKTRDDPADAALALGLAWGAAA